MRFFISYSSKDSELADEVAAMLEELGMPYFRDAKDIQIGDDIPAAVTLGLKACTHILVLLSPASLKSHWVPYELGQAKARGITIVPYLQHPDLDIPGYIRNMLHVARLKDLRTQLLRLAAKPQPSTAISRESRVFGGFLVLEPFEDDQFTAPRSAHGWHDLRMSLECIAGDDNSVFHIRPVRTQLLARPGFRDCALLCLRVGSPELHGVVRQEIDFPWDSEEATISAPLITPHGWDLGETKQFFATAGPVADPSRHRSGPLTVKRVE